MNYPDDFRMIADICYGRFNTRLHQCGKRISITVPVVAARSASMELVIVGEPPEEIVRSLSARGWSVSVVDDYNGLAYHVLKWIEQDSTTFWSSILDGSFRKLSLREAVNRLSAIQLLAFKLTRDSRVGVLVAPEGNPSATPVPSSDDELVSHVVRIGTRLTVDQLKRVVRLAIFDGLGGRLEEAVLGRVPIDCLDDQVLDSLATDAESASALSPNDVLEVYYLLVTCAVAHRLAQSENPAGTLLAAFLAELYELGQRDYVDLDERVWLTREQLRRLVDAGSALGAAAELGRRDERGPLSLLSQDFLDRIGWLDLISGMTVRVRDYEAFGEFDTAAFAETMLTVALNQKDTGGDDWELGQLTAGAVFQTMRTNLPIDEQELLNHLAKGLAERASLIAHLAFQTGVIEYANRVHRIDLSTAAALKVLRGLSEADVGPERAVAALVEVGNTFRYLQRWNEALQLYESAMRISRLMPEGHAKRESVLARNRALVLRDAHRFSEAEAILKERLRTHSEDCDTQESLILLYERVGRRKEALTMVEEQLARNDLSPYDTARFLRLRALLKAWFGQHDAAAADCQAALEAHVDPWERREIETCALLTEPADEQLDTFVADCEHRAAEILDGPHLENPFMALSAATLATLRRLRAGRITQAGELIGKIADWLDALKAKGSWQFELAVGWHAVETGRAEAFGHLTTAIADLDAQLPVAAEAGYAVGVLADFAIDDLQRLAARTGAAAIASGRNKPADLVPVLDVANGRDLTARASVSTGIPDAGPATVEALDHFQGAVGADVVAFVDDTPTLQVLLQPAGGNKRLVDTDIPIAEVGTAVRALRAFDLTNPLAPHRMDSHLAPWWDFAAAIASLLRHELPSTRELVVLPGRLLVATPLHAAGWPGRPLIADRPVSVSPNHRLLVGWPTVAAPGHGTVPYGLIGVPKATDTAAFTDKLVSFIDEFRARAPQARVVPMTEADEAASLAVLGEAEMVLLLCHGVHGGPELGPGICVAAGGILPPSYLDVAADADLGVFVLSWDDIIQLPHSPALLVSIACSSGRTVVGSGGSRLGLEQGTLANATRFVVAPLWPVEQHSALAWVDALLEPMDLAADQLALQRLPELHRAATLALADKYPHPYHWAPFALSTALRGEAP
ncbi:CHAT domain-containing protein [Streptomyces sp. HC307]|uniref:CHAT domain-containing protein n=1 Tax=Streptomyces flavusporus TaxID=3385496 RepID=UPI003916F1F4